MIRKVIFSLVFTVLSCLGVSAQVLAEVPDNATFINNTYNSFINYYKKGINEKLYIQTDKPYYSAGEKIWFKGFLVNSITHAPLRNTNFIYIQLVNKHNELFTRIKIKADDYGFHNNIDLPNDMPEGEYTLTAFTKWMTNWGEDTYYYKKINIANPIDDAYTVTAAYKAAEKGNIDVIAKIKASTGTIPSGIKVLCQYYIKGKEKNVTGKVSSDGSIVFRVPGDLSSPAVRLESMDNDISFEKTVYAPTLEDKLDVQFFPEGGNLISGKLQTVVFKAVGVDGKGRDVHGDIFNARDEKIAEFETEFKGMGRFSFLSDANSTYYANVYEKTDTATVLRVEMPQVLTTGCSIKAMVDKTNLIYQILVTDDIDTSKIGVVVHSRGKIVNSALVGQNNKLKRIPLYTLPEGVLTIAIVDLQTYVPIAERLVFVPLKNITTTMEADRPSYSKRSNVNLDFTIAGAEGKPIEGEFAVSVTDSNPVKTSFFHDNIISSLLLDSDLQGYIEGINDYFTGDVVKDMSNRELLMLTQGWKRFSLTNVLKNEVPYVKEVPEDAHVISGNIKGFFGNDARKPNLVIMNTKTKFFDIYPLETSSHFRIEGIDFPDSTELVLQGINKRGSGYSLNLVVDEEVFPQPKFVFPNTLIDRQKEEFVPETYLFQSKERYYYEGGMRVIDMEEIVVTADAADGLDGAFKITPTEYFTAEDLEDMAYMTVFQALEMLPGVTYDGETISIGGSEDTPLVYVDDVETDYDLLQTVTMDMVEAIGVLEGVDAVIYGTGSEAGVILIKLKTGQSLTKNVKSLASLNTVKHLGYKRPEMHYQPKYEIPEELTSATPDLRTTICWNPCVQTGSDGKVSINFYTADRDTTYDVTIEGVSKDGELVHYRTTIEKKDLAF